MNITFKISNEVSIAKCSDPKFVRYAIIWNDAKFPEDTSKGCCGKVFELYRCGRNTGNVSWIKLGDYVDVTEAEKAAENDCGRKKLTWSNPI